MQDVRAAHPDTYVEYDVAYTCVGLLEYHIDSVRPFSDVADKCKAADAAKRALTKLTKFAEGVLPQKTRKRQRRVVSGGRRRSSKKAHGRVSLLRVPVSKLQVGFSWLVLQRFSWVLMRRPTPGSPRSPGLARSINLHQKSTPEINSNGDSCPF